VVALDGLDKVGTAHRDGNPVPTSGVAGPAVLKRQTGAICNRVTTPVVRVRIPAAGPKHPHTVIKLIIIPYSKQRE